jgi:hypothetical protein
VNKDKGNRTAMDYFEAGSLTQSIRPKEVFIDEVNKRFFGAKRRNLLATKVPEDPIARQLKDSQYIAVRTKEELNKVVGNENVKTTTGNVTDYLRNQWGLTDKFKDILKHRYQAILENEKYLESEYKAYTEEMEEKKKEYEKAEQQFKEVILDKDHFIDLLKQNAIKYKNGKLILKGWTKRIDHRHHAIDALITACTEQAHIQTLNNLNKELQDWLEKHRSEFLPYFQGTANELLDELMNLEESKRREITKQLEKFREIPMPWIGFPESAGKAIRNIIVSQKPKDKLIIQKNEKDKKLQIKIRGQLHEGTIYGKSQNSESYRIPLLKLSGKNFATEKTIEKIANPFLKEEIRLHLKSNNGNKEDAFSAEGILDLQNKLASKKNKKGKVAPHTPLNSIKIFYQDPSKKKTSAEGEENDTLQKLNRKKAFNNSLYVKTGDNYLFAVMSKEIFNKTKKLNENVRTFDLITFFDATNLLKEGFNNTYEKHKFEKNTLFKTYFESTEKAKKENAKLLFTLKQGDYVYLPPANEDTIIDESSSIYDPFWKDKENRSKNVFIVQKFSGNEIYFLKHSIADVIKKKVEFGSQDCYQSLNGKSIKEHCIKLSVDRLGNIKPAK